MRSLLFIDEPSIGIRAWGGSLVLWRKGHPEPLVFPPRIHHLRTIILAGHGASISIEALRWLAREGVALYLMERSGECLALFAAAPETDGRRRSLAIRQKQFAAVLDPCRRMAIAKRIVAAKLRTLGLHPADTQRFRAELREARGLPDVLTVEAHAGVSFYMQFRGAEMRFKDKVPGHWRVFVARSTTYLRGKMGTSKARYASAPWNAALNYAFGVALGQCTRAVIGAGLDPCFGFLHAPKPGRLSLPYDVLELHRADLTRKVFAFCQGRTFSSGDFETTREGIVRLSAPVAKDVATVALRTAPITECVKTVKRVITWF